MRLEIIADGTLANGSGQLRKRGRGNNLHARQTACSSCLKKIDVGTLANGSCQTNMSRKERLLSAQVLERALVNHAYQLTRMFRFLNDIRYKTVTKST